MRAVEIAELIGRPELVVLSGLHAVKHAQRFGAEILSMVSDDLTEVRRLADELCPDLDLAVAKQLVPQDFRALIRRPPPTGLIAVARRPSFSTEDALAPGGGPVVFLEDPRHSGNAGAVIRVAAAAGARSVVSSGALDLWDEAVVRGAAGLHYALRVGSIDRLSGPRKIIAFDPEGDLFDPREIGDDVVLAFGTERSGLSPELRAAASSLVRLPMRPNVSSLNLATSVSAALYLLSYRDS